MNNVSSLMTSQRIGAFPVRNGENEHQWLAFFINSMSVTVCQVMKVMWNKDYNICVHSVFLFWIIISSFSIIFMWKLKAPPNSSDFCLFVHRSLFFRCGYSIQKKVLQKLFWRPMLLPVKVVQLDGIGCNCGVLLMALFSIFVARNNCLAFTSVVLKCF